MAVLFFCWEKEGRTSKMRNHAENDLDHAGSTIIMRVFKLSCEIHFYHATYQ